MITIKLRIILLITIFNVIILSITENLLSIPAMIITVITVLLSMFIIGNIIFNNK
jgi:hypothetical protein